MKTFREHLKEDVLPSAQVADGSMDLRNATVVAAVNAALAGVTGQPAVTPYVVYNRISKLLAQYHIIMPKKFLEGDKGVEVFELRQYGMKMGMTDSGEFINEVPSTHYLFLQYGIITPFGVTYAKPVVGGMFRVMARIVDKPELDRLLDMAEITMKEEAECRQMAAKAMAPKEPMHDVTSDEKKKGNKEAVADSEKGLNETHADNIRRKYRQKEDDNDHTGNVHLMTRVFGSKKERETSKGLLRKRDKQGYVTGSDSQKGYNMTKNYARRMEKLKEEELDEVSKGAAIRAYGAARDASDSNSRADEIGDRLKKHIVRKFDKKTGEHAERHASASHFGRPGQDFSTDRLAHAKPSSEMRKTKSGKVHKQDVESKKSEIKFRKTMSKFDKPRGHLPEETVDEGSVSIGHPFTWAGDVNHKAHFYGKKPKATTTKNDEKDDTYKNSKQGGKVKFAKPVKEAYKVTGTKGSETSDRYEMRTHAPGEHHEWSSIVKTHQGGKSTQNKWGGYSSLRTGKTKYVKKHFDKLEEKLTKDMPAGEVVSDFVHSKAKTFKGDTKKERISRALGAYYGMHPEKSKVNEAMGSVKKASAFRAMKRKVSTQVKAGLGVEGPSKTIQVTSKNDPERKVRRIAKDRFDPSKYVKV